MATKKLKKAATPVDQRETFVSLQQSFAENGVDVKEKIKTLYDLQKADSEIDKILQLRGELPTEVKALEDEVEGIKARIEKVNAEVQQMTDSINHEKENIVDCDNQIAKYQKQLDDIANSREYDSINKEIENETLLRQIAEKNIKDARMKIAESHDKTNALKDQLTVSEDSLAAKHKELDNIVESTAKEEARLRAIREKHPRQRQEPPRSRNCLQRRLLRRLLQRNPAPETCRHQRRRQAHDLRELRTHHRQQGSC